MLANRSIPNSTVIPELAYPNVGEAVTRLCNCFGFTLRIRIGNHRAQLNVGDGAVVLIEAGAGFGIRSSVLVRIEDIDEHYARAVEYGLKVLRPPADYPYGERQYSIEDFAGHQWNFSQSIADVDPSEWGGTRV